MTTIPATTLKAPSQAKALRKLFLTLFLRGRSARGLNKKNVPTSVGRKLALVLLFYGFFGCLAFSFVRQPIFVLSLYLHAMTFVFLGMFTTASAGDVLFNKEEADILLHRPITPGALLWAKIRVLVEVSLWIAGAFNLVGLLVGIAAPNGDWRFPIVHALSTVLEALWCTGCVVMVYQLCLRWFGRERLDGILTATQIVVSLAVMLGGQLMPQVAFQMHNMNFGGNTWWIGFLPPAWFAGFDDALAGSGAAGSWIFAAIALAATAIVMWIAFAKLSQDYGRGMQTMQEGTASSPGRAKRSAGRWGIERLVRIPPWRWLLRNPVSRASFLLVVRYMWRDRDMKLRLYPGIAPMLVVPLIFILRTAGKGGFQVAFAGGYLGMVPMMGLTLLQYSQQWQASDVFRMSPLMGPGPLCHGARCAILSFLTLPMFAILGAIAVFLLGNWTMLLLMIPGMITLPIYALIPNLGGKAVPLSASPDGAKSAGRGLSMIVVIMISMALSGLAYGAWLTGWFVWFIAGEILIAGGMYALLHRWVARAHWRSVE